MNKKLPIKFLILEGADSSGKSSFKHEFNKETGSTWCVIDRLFGSLLVYGWHNHREVNVELSRYIQEDNRLAKEGAVVVYFYADEKETSRRLKECGDDDITIDQLKPLQTLYNHYLRTTKMKVIKINTTKLTKQQVVDRVINKLKKIGFNYYAK